MTIEDNLFSIEKRIRAAEEKYFRPEHAVKLIAVSKAQCLDKITAAIKAGQKSFGENYLQEALKKITALCGVVLDWHFIGAIQSNKTRAIAENFLWVHSVNRIKIAEQLNQYRPTAMPPLNVCIQVNLSGEVTKQGVCLDELLMLAQAIENVDRLVLRGLMVIPARVDDFSQQREMYEQMAKLQQSLVSSGISLDTLSMGMSHDFEAAIAAGSTMVRIGQGIFGKRNKV